MKILLFISIFLISSFKPGCFASAFSECLRENSGTAMSIADLKEISKVSRVTYCQNQVGLVGKLETMDLLSSPNVQVGVSVSKTSYSQADLLDMAGAGSYVLYVDSSRLGRDALIALANAGFNLW